MSSSIANSCCRLFLVGLVYWMTLSASQANVPEGFIDVTAAPYLADKTGQTDSTLALQTAINDARDNNLVVWLPGGTYLVSARLEVDQPDNDGSFPVVLMGSTVNPQNRATITLAANAPGFNDPAARRAVLHYFNTGTVSAEGGNTDLYNQAVIGVDFKIRSGNAGAVALRMQGAEGCTIQDVNIDLTEGGHTGIWGVPGSGGSTHKVTITGGVIGIDTRKINQASNNDGGGSQPTVVITGSTFVNQSGQALYSSSRGATVLVGCRILRNTPGAAIRLRKHWVGQPFDGSFHFIDSTIDYATYNVANTVIDFQASNLGRSFHFENSYVRQGHQVFTASAPANTSGWRRYHRLAVHDLPTSRNEAIAWQPKETPYIDGAASTDVTMSHTDEAPPSDLQSRHQWHEDFPTWEHPGVVNVKTLGAKGDGITDDWAIIQSAITNNEKVFFPKGTYQVSKTLDLRPDSKLIGGYHTFTRIRAISTLNNRFAGTTEAAGDRPIIRTVDSATADTVIAFIGIRRLFPLAQHNPTPVGNYAIEWRCAGTSLVRHVEVESKQNTNMRPDLIAQNFYKYNLATNPINPNHPQRDFQAGHWAWPVSEPTVQIRGNGGGRWFNFWMHGRQGLRSHVPFIRVEGTSQPLNIYHLHIQQQDSINHAEFINAANVSIFGGKGELKGTFAYFEGCNNVRFIGHGGMSSPDPAVNPPFLFRFINTDNFLIAGVGTDINEGSTVWKGTEFDRWIHTHVMSWKPILDQHSGRAQVQVPSDTRPIIYVRGNPSTQAVSNNFGRTITIHSPADGATLPQGSNTWFFGSASTNADGNVSHQGTWTSSINGNLGTGASVSTASLSLGLHTITYSVTLPGGVVLSKQISVSVETPPPSTQTVAMDTPPVADSYVRSDVSLRNTNYGSQEYLSPTLSGPAPGYLRFSLGGLPATVESAKLVLTTTTNTNVGTLTIHQLVSTTWTESGVTWNNRPTLGAAIGTMAFTGATYLERELDVTAYVNSQIATGQVNFGATSSVSFLRFFSRESAYPPRLEITYTLVGQNNQAPTALITSPAASPLSVALGQAVTFTGTVTDPEDGAITASAAWYSSRDGLLGTGGSRTVSNLTSGTHTITFHATDSGGKSTAATTVVQVANAPPTIATQPQSAVVSSGGTAALSVTANGSGLSYQWYVGASGNTAAPISGATSATFTTPALSSTTSYWVRVSNSGGQVNSAAAIVTVNNPPAITITSPAGNSIASFGSAVSLTATASDTEDGTLSAAIAWASSINGSLGTGASINATGLFAGTHRLTASVTDSGGRTSTQTVEIKVWPGGLLTQRFDAGSTVSSYAGTAANLFDFIGTDTNATNNRATLSIVEGRLRNTIAYTNDGNIAQVSAARLTRLTDLPVEQDFAVLYATVRLAPSAWPSSGDISFLSMVIGENFRTGIFSPNGGTGNGPAFSTLNLQARGGTTDTFRVTRAPHSGSTINGANFTITPADGIYTADIVLAVNSGASARTFSSPTGNHTLQPDALSLWVNNALIFNNATDGLTASALIRDVSFAMGSGTGSNFTTGSVFNGYYEIDDIRVATLTGFTPLHTVTFTAGSGGSLTGTTTQVVQNGNATTAVTAVPAEGFQFNSWTWSGGSSTSNPLSIPNITQNLAVTANFGVLNTAPTVAITAPANATSITQGNSVTFTGTATDAQDGNLASIATWSSSLNGVLGTGASLSTSSLTVGVHTITYAVTDSGGLSHSAQITLNVLDPSGAVATNFTGGNLVNAGSWSNGLPLVADVPSKIGTIAVNGTFNNPVTGWNVQQTSGELTSGFNRSLGAADASSPGTLWNMSGGSWNFGASTITRGTVGNNYAYTLNVSGGLIVAGAMQVTSGAFLVITGGSITLSGTLSASGGIITFGAGSGSLQAASITTGTDTRINFLDGAQGTLSITNLLKADYVTLWTQGRLRRNGSNAGNFDDFFVVNGSVLSLRPADPYAYWKVLQNLSGPSALDTADPDSDGIPNLLEYALGGNPSAANSAILPAVGTAVVDTQTRVTISFQRIADPALVYEVWASGDLVNWGVAPIWTSTGVQNTAGPVMVTDSVNLQTQGRRFLRLRVTRQ